MGGTIALCFLSARVFSDFAGSAMMELAYDIASGANYKFNTMFEGIVVRLLPFACLCPYG